MFRFEVFAGRITSINVWNLRTCRRFDVPPDLGWLATMSAKVHKNANTLLHTITWQSGRHGHPLNASDNGKVTSSAGISAISPSISWVGVNTGIAGLMWNSITDGRTFSNCEELHFHMGTCLQPFTLTWRFPTLEMWIFPRLFFWVSIVCSTLIH